MNPMKRNSRIQLLLLLSLAFVLTGCRVRRPSDVMSPKEMERILYDYHLAQAEIMNLPRDQRYKRDAYLNWVFQKNNITREEFETSLVWYTRYPKEMAEVYKKMNLRIADDYQYAADMVARAKKGSVDVLPGDSIDLWYMDRLQVMNTSDYMNRVLFAITADTTFHKGDTITMSFLPAFVRSNPQVPSMAYVNLYLQYNDSVSTADTIIADDGPVELTLILDRKIKMSRLNGSIIYMDSTDNRSSALLMSGLKLMRYHEREQQ